VFNKIVILYGSEVKVMELVLWIIIGILFGHIVCIKMDLNHSKKRLDTYKEMLDIQNEKIDDVWEYVKKL
ncbi:hypothetical protein, partial [Bacillus sp. BB56-3]|uniref:hypothetical protein n=2 Tax=Bacillus cereus group TaxID=86661 RepID=UPI00132615DA